MKSISTKRRNRAGLTVLEFLGCVTAVLGGMWLGALYLGVNVEHLAHSVLEEAQLLDKVPEQWRPQGPTKNVVTREQMLATLRKEIGSLRTEILSLHASDPHDHTPPISANVEAAKTNTKNYWQRLNEIVVNEETLQRDAAAAIDDANAARVFAIKGRVSRFAAQSIEAVPRDGVDESVVKFGRQLLLWYNKGGALYEEAVQIWESPAGQLARTQLTEKWKQAESQHRDEARLLRERASVLRGSMSRQFAEEFPEFAAPETPAAPAEPAATTAAAS
jgi:hypothetical protein